MIWVHLRINHPSFPYPSLESFDVSDFNISFRSICIFPVNSYLSSRFHFPDIDSWNWPLDSIDGLDQSMQWKRDEPITDWEVTGERENVICDQLSFPWFLCYHVYFCFMSIHYQLWSTLVLFYHFFCFIEISRLKFLLR